MVKSDICQHGNFRRLDNISGIELPSEADFKDNDVAFHLTEINHAYGSDDFKVARIIFHCICCRLYFLCNSAEISFGNLLSADSDPFPEFFQIRRRKESGFIPGITQDGLYHGRCGAFAVGSAYMDKLELILRITQHMKKLARPRQPELPLIESY